MTSKSNFNLQLNNDGTLTINEDRIRYRYDGEEDCYRLYEQDVYQKLSKHQMKQYYLLGRPVYAELLSANSPK